MIILSNFIVLDPEYYGPEISYNCFLIPVRQLKGVNPGSLSKGGDRKSKVESSLVLAILGKRILGLDIQANVVRFGIEFHHETNLTTKVYNLLSQMCRKAEEMREREKFKPFDSPEMTRVLEVRKPQ